jgi:hypothetical protein
MLKRFIALALVRKGAGKRAGGRRLPRRLPNPRGRPHAVGL